MPTTITRIAPRILTDAFTALLDEIEQAAPIATDPRRDSIEQTLFVAYESLWHGVPVEIAGDIYHIEIAGQQHTVNGKCSCGQPCAARVAKKLLQLVKLQTPAPKQHSGYPCIHCPNSTLQPSRTPAGESAYECPECRWTVTTVQIGSCMVANRRCAYCGARRVDDCDAVDQYGSHCPNPRCAGYEEWYA